jgi:8-oxo-dGTP diphosphatase
MKREYPDAPIVGVGAIIVDEGRVVLVKRAHLPMLGEWSIPGGAVELGETVREAVIREAREETGLDVEPMALLGVFDRVIRDHTESVRYHYVLVDYYCRQLGGELCAGSDCDGARWFSPEEVAGMPLLKDTAEVVRWGFEKAGDQGQNRR